MVFLALSLVWVTSVSSAQAPAKPLYVLEDSYLRWRLLPAEQAYLSIDGKHLKEYVEEQTAISRRYRDHGHPQFWGRITGTEADAENAQWLLDKFRKIGLTDVRGRSCGARSPRESGPLLQRRLYVAAGSDFRLCHQAHW